MKKKLLFIPLLLTFFLLTACTQDTEVPQADNAVSAEAAITTPSAQPSEVSVRIKDMVFVPETLTIKTGDTVNWLNEDEVTHRIIFDGLYDSGKLDASDSFSVNFLETGTFDYYCMLHPSMKGKIVVE